MSYIWALGATVAHLVYTEEVRGSNPLAPIFFLLNMKINSDCLSKTLKKLTFENLSNLVYQFFNHEVAQHKSSDLIRLSLKIQPIDILKWLHTQSISPKIYWSERHSRLEVAGIGNALDISGHSKQAFEQFKPEKLPDKMRIFGGFCFDEQSLSQSEWKEFGACKFFIPRFELLREEQDYIFSIQFKLASKKTQIIQKTELIEELTKLKFNNFQAYSKLNYFQFRTDYPTQENWIKQTESTLNQLENSDIEKIVLARKITLSFKEKIDIYSLLFNLKKITPDSFHFCFQLTPHKAFIGSSPERLYRRFKNNLFSEAIAGTRLRGNSPEYDNQLGEDLLHSEKDLREHRFVSKFIYQSLKPLCNEIEIDPAITLLKRRYIQHLYRGIRGVLKNDIRDIDILKKIHPTPAVGGFPQEKAIKLISQTEEFNRGWYAGTLGWLTNNHSEFAVGIRSALIDQDQIHLYAGAGLVKGSKPLREWEEIESKINNYLILLTNV